MRATQFVRRGLIAFAAVATISAGLAGTASAEYGVLEGGTAGITSDGDAIVANPVPGFTYQVITTPGFGETAILAEGIVPGTPAVAVRFVPDVNGAAVLYLVQPDVIAERQ
jgi:hypothetical protein